MSLLKLSTELSLSQSSTNCDTGCFWPTPRWLSSQRGVSWSKANQTLCPFGHRVWIRVFFLLFFRYLVCVGCYNSAFTIHMNGNEMVILLFICLNFNLYLVLTGSTQACSKLLLISIIAEILLLVAADIFLVIKRSRRY